MSNNKSTEQIINEKRIEISNYIKALKSLLCLRKLVTEKLTGNFYFGSKLTYKEPKGRDPQTPDFIVKLTDSVWVGEIKRALPDPNKFDSEDAYIKKVVEEKIISQLKKYDESFSELEPEEQNIILMAPSRDVEAVGVLKIKYLERKETNNEKVFENNFALLLYYIEPGANNNEFIIIKLDYGSLTNGDARDILRIGYKKMVSEIKDDLAKFKVYEETDKTPIEYVMVLLWTEIFPEIIGKSNVEKIIEWRDKKEHIFEVKLDHLVEYLHRMYTLPSLNENDRKQFSTKLVIDAMNRFSAVRFRSERTGKFEPAVTKREENGSIIFTVTYKSLPEKDELNYILKSIYSKEKPHQENNKQEPLKYQCDLRQWFDSHKKGDV